jgi:Domain of unknown function (DUF1840)
MIYKFKSAAAGDLIMLEPQGKHLLQLIGKQPGPKGIILPGDMPAAIAALQAAVAAEEAASQGKAGADLISDNPTADADAPAPAISLRRRVWPFVEMLKLCEREGKEVVWGV